MVKLFYEIFLPPFVYMGIFNVFVLYILYFYDLFHTLFFTLLNFGSMEHVVCVCVCVCGRACAQ
jgi:hypothetical protein